MSHKRSKVVAATGVQLGLIITPMLDMSFQILAFFIMTYHPSALEGHIPGNLTPPEDYAKKSKDANPAAPPDPLLALPNEMLDESLNDSITVYVKAMVKDQEPRTRAEGEPSQIFVKSNVETDRQMVADVDVEFDKALDLLEARLKKMAAGGKANLKIAADGGLRYQYVLLVYDTAKRAGFEKVHFVPPALNKTKIRQ